MILQDSGKSSSLRKTVSDEYYVILNIKTCNHTGKVPFESVLKSVWREEYRKNKNNEIEIINEIKKPKKAVRVPEYIAPASKPDPSKTINVRIKLGANFVYSPMISKIIGASIVYTSKTSATPRV